MSFKDNTKLIPPGQNTFQLQKYTALPFSQKTVNNIKLQSKSVFI